MAATNVMTLPLVPYFELAPHEREAIHGWLAEHRVDHTAVPVNAPWSLDAATNEWRIPAFHRRDGRFHANEDGDIAMVTVRRVMKRPLPWRRLDEGKTS